jgi:adenylate cyclase
MLENAEAALEREFDRSEGLLLNLMPTSIASRLKNDPSEIIADHFDEVTILLDSAFGHQRARPAGAVSDNTPKC